MIQEPLVPGSPPPEPDLRERIRAEQIRMVYMHSPTTTGGSLVAAAFLIAVLWDTVSHASLLAWGATMVVYQVFRIASYRRYLAARPSAAHSRPWGRLYILMTTIAGCLWGSTGILFYVPESTISQVYLCLVLFGVASLTIPTLSLFAPAFYPLVVLVLMPFILRSLATGQREQIALAIPLVIALVMSVTFGRKINRLIDESISRRFENLSLVEIAERARREAERSNRAKSEFLAAMSHELRTPLNAIIGYSELMTQQPARFGTQGAQDPLERVLRAGRHLLNLINELLELAKIEAGKTSFAFEDVDVAALLRDVASTTQSLADQNQNQVFVSAPDTLAPMRTDPKRLTQVILNLLSNACKFTDNGRIDISLVQVQSDGRTWLELAVKDTGIGMSHEQTERLFEEFFQGDAATHRKYGGTGLGLAISRRICRAMGGDLNVVSELGKGSTFTARLPEQPPQDAAIPEPARRESVTATGSPAQRTGVVLVIDDDREAREQAAERLADHGFDIATAPDGMTGLQLARKLNPSAITLDIVMPGLNGWSVLAALKEDPELFAIPVVVLAALGSEVKKGFALGAAACLSKPVDYGLLADTLKGLTGGNRSPSDG
ncbi:MAG: response regulator [Burkholderiales bacterium]|nr:response regulator [Burkholderiales bacterium]